MSPAVPVLLPTCQPVTCAISPIFSWEFGFISCQHPFSLDCSTSAQTQPIIVSAEQAVLPLILSTPSLRPMCGARSDALKLCHSMPASHPQKAGDQIFPSLWVRKWRCRKTRQQAQVTQFSECRGQDQTQVFLTPKSVLSAGSHRSTGSQPWNLRKAGKNTHAAPPHTLPLERW